MVSRTVSLVFLRHQLHHLGVHSGYENFIPALRAENLICREVHRTRTLERTAVLRRLQLSRFPEKEARHIGQFYNRFSFLAEKETFQAARSYRAGLVHNTFLEDNHGFLGKLKNRVPFRLLATSHMPAGWWKYIRKSTLPLHDLDLLLTLTSKEKDFFEQVIPGRVRRVHHGVDAAFFTPGPSFSERPLRILVVGNMLRDYIFFEEVIAELLGITRNIKVDMVCSPQNEMQYPVFKLCRYPQVTLHHHIPDEQLRTLYQQSRLLFLPLVDGTANNALLEAAACGLPVVTTDLEGTREYGSPAFTYYYKNKKDCLEYILETIGNVPLLEEYSRKARTLVTDHFTLDRIAGEHLSVYRELADF